MGGLFSRFDLNHDYSLLKGLCKVKPPEINELVEYYLTYYSDSSLLSFDQFDELFSPYVNEIYDSFEELKTKSNKVDWYEILAITVLSSDTPSQWKISTLYSLFDFDQSGNIDEREFTMTLGIVAKALAKICKAEVPSPMVISERAHDIFREIDADSNLTIDHEEIISWTNQNKEIQELIGKLSKKQGIELASLRYKDIMKKYEDMFAKYGHDPLTPEETATFWQEFVSMNEITPEEEQEFKRMAIRTDNCMHQEDIFEALKHWVAFIVADYSGDKLLNPEELRTMLGFVKGEEVPLDFVQENLKLIDIDADGAISRLNILQFLSVTTTVDDGLAMKLKHSFDLVDVDGSLKINATEMELLLKNAVFDEGEEIRPEQEELLKAIAEDCMILNDENQINWVDFKRLLPKIQDKIKRTKQLI